MPEGGISVATSETATCRAKALTVDIRDDQVAGPHCDPAHAAASFPVIRDSPRAFMKPTKLRSRFSWLSSLKPRDRRRVRYCSSASTSPVIARLPARADTGFEESRYQPSRRCGSYWDLGAAELDRSR